MSRRGARVAVTAQATAVVVFGLVTAAHALWSVDDVVLQPMVQTGSVAFAAGSEGAPPTVSAGGAVVLTLPGSRVADVLDRMGPDPEPVLWRFTATGAALGIAGLSYDVQVTAQVAPDGTRHDLSGGVARPGTVLAGSTMSVYPAAGADGTDCSAVPAAPAPAEGEAPRNVHAHAAAQHVLQQPGANPDGEPVTQTWCVALTWNHDPDGRYANDVHVVARGADGTSSRALDQWRAGVAFPPLLDASGTYAGRGSVAALGEDGTTSRAHDDWWAVLHPDPDGEPDVTLTLSPAVTTLATSGAAPPTDP
ncbi:hypothetical protein [Cellulosimicrobium cellulans]|uniref:hypothetical protein n=1 Tax=Cellulosimicrobium cellulans TaxID=1710 RepID=UPI00130DBE07|nr:hypothetical protein [Cellulosimicrobium cellulans]